MGDSDEEYERRRRDKFRRERTEYQDGRREDRRGGRGEPWEEREREVWGSRNREGGRREQFRDYDRNRRDRYSPQRNDMSPPQMKRMRRDWDEGGRYNHYDGPYGGGGAHLHGGPPHHGAGGNWSGPPGEMPPPQHYGGGQRGLDMDFPTQPPMMLFKHFLGQQDDNITDEEAIRKYNDYKLEFRKTQINEFFLAHKEEEWFKAKYHPEECGKRREEQRNALKRRAEVFHKLLEMGRINNVSCDLERSNELVKVLDAAVILMEGGTDFDLNVLDLPQDERSDDNNRSRNDSESQSEKPREDLSQSNADKADDADAAEGSMEEGEMKQESPKAGETEKKDEEKEPLKMVITPEQEELKKKAAEFSQKQKTVEENGQDKKKRPRDKTNYSYESGSDSDSGSESEVEGEPGPPGNKSVDEPPPPGTEGEEQQDTKKEEGATEEKEEDSAEQPEEGEEEPQPQALHKTNSIFLRNLAPSITKQEVEAMCKRYPGFMRVALQDPQPERRFLRRGWVTFDRTVNIKDICWNLNNIRLRDCEMGAIVNRELKQRIRPISGLAAHKLVVKADIKNAAKIVQNLDQKWNLWEDKDNEKKDGDKQSFGLVSNNPVLKNITDYLVEEGDYEEEELLGQAIDEKPKEANPEVNIERDEKLSHVLDRMILYLRTVHSLDYYSAVEYPNEDEMPHRCGIMHARGHPPPNRLTQHDMNDWIHNFEQKVSGFVNMRLTLDNEETVKLGRKDADAEVEKFVTANAQELAKDKWLCPLSGKKFKGPEFVRKHIFNKHGEKVEEVKKEVSFFNNYLMDAKRPQLPEHPGNRHGAGPPPRQDSFGMAQHAHQGPPQQGMMGGGPRPHMMGGGYQGMGGYQSSGYQNRHENYRRESPRDRYGPRRDRGRPDPRGIIEYRDLDAPDDMDIF